MNINRYFGTLTFHQIKSKSSTTITLWSSSFNTNGSNSLVVFSNHPFYMKSKWFLERIDTYPCRLFMDSFEHILEALLLYIENSKISISNIYTVYTKETFDDMEVLPQAAPGYIANIWFWFIFDWYNRDRQIISVNQNVYLSPSPTVLG